MKKLVLTSTLSILLLCLILSSGKLQVEAEGQVIVYLDPGEIQAALGQTFSVDLNVADVPDLVGFQYRFKWNSTILQCIGYEKCDPAVDMNWSMYMTPVDRLTVDQHFFAIDGVLSHSPFSGNVTLATYTYQIVGIGNCVLDVYDVILANSSFEPIDGWHYKDSPDDCHFEFRRYEHDLAVLLETPTQIIPGGSTLLTTTVFNDGLNNESNVELQLRINGSVVNSTVLDLLTVDSFYTLDCLWAVSTVEALYNVTAYVSATSGEELTANNVKSESVIVSYAIKVPQDYQTIQEAIDAADPKDVILVTGGTYCEHLTIDKSLTLVGEETDIPTIDGNQSDRCLFVTADRVNVCGFVIQNGLCGIDVQHASFATIVGNKIVDNEIGISLSTSYGNTIFGNTLLDNYIGLGLLDSCNNTVSHNSFINSTKLQFVETGGQNSLHGNYWSDYKGIDADGDGVGDVPHVFDEDNTDEHPVVIPLDPVPILWNGTFYQIEFESNSTVSEIDFLSTQKSLSFNVTGLDGTIGFCNLTIPNSLLQDLWQGNYTVLIDGDQPLTIANWTDGTITSVHFTYSQSEHEVTVIPEFPSALILLLSMIGTLFATICCRKNRQLH